MQLLCCFVVFNSIIIRLTCLRACIHTKFERRLQEIYLGPFEYGAAHNRPNNFQVYESKHSSVVCLQVSKQKKEWIVKSNLNNPFLKMTNKNLREFFHTNPYWHATHLCVASFFVNQM